MLYVFREMLIKRLLLMRSKIDGKKCMFVDGRKRSEKIWRKR
jgi:hypothetical protein